MILGNVAFTERAMRFRIRETDHLWSWALVNDAEETVAQSPHGFPSAAQASAAALAFAQLVNRAGKALTIGPRGGTLL